jgi:hypothetical protein
MAEAEQERWRRTVDIMKRVQPGPLEDPSYLEMLARQAASVEMSLRGGELTSGFPPELLALGGFCSSGSVGSAKGPLHLAIGGSMPSNGPRRSRRATAQTSPPGRGSLRRTTGCSSRSRPTHLRRSSCCVRSGRRAPTRSPSGRAANFETKSTSSPSSVG